MKDFVTQDVYLASALLVLGNDPRLEKNDIGRVFFVFTGDPKLYKSLDLLNKDIPFPISTYIACSKALRGKMISLRNEKGKSE